MPGDRHWHIHHTMPTFSTCTFFPQFLRRQARKNWSLRLVHHPIPFNKNSYPISYTHFLHRHIYAATGTHRCATIHTTYIFPYLDWCGDRHATVHFRCYLPGSPTPASCSSKMFWSSTLTFVRRQAHTDVAILLLLPLIISAFFLRRQARKKTQ